MEILEHYPLGECTTFKVGGLALYFTRAQVIEDIHASIIFAKERQIPIIFLGGGSNTLVDDGETNALFVQVDLQGVVQEENRLTASAGESWDSVVEYAVKSGLYGIENLSGIPGSVGGAVVQNIGAYGAALSEYVESVEVFELETGKRTTRTVADCLFGYRTSVFKEQPDRFLVLSVTLTLSTVEKYIISYRDIAEYFFSVTPTLPGMRSAVLSIREGKFPDLSMEGCAGSFFKNPIVSLAEGERLQQKYPGLPLFPLPEAAGYKVPVAWIMDHVLSMRGFALGPVRCFEKQPLVLVAERRATAKDVRALAHEVVTRVQHETNIRIEPEVCVLRSSVIAHTLDF